MFKFAHKISSYGDESRIDFNLSKRKLNCRFKYKVLYCGEYESYVFGINKIYSCKSDYVKYWYLYNFFIVNSNVFHERCMYNSDLYFYRDDNLCYLRDDIKKPVPIWKL